MISENTPNKNELIANSLIKDRKKLIIQLTMSLMETIIPFNNNIELYMMRCRPLMNKRIERHNFLTEDRRLLFNT